MPIDAEVAQIAVEDWTGCALLTDGRVRCWGRRGAYGYTDYVGDRSGPSIIEAGDIQL